MGLRLAVALWRFWMMRGYPQEGFDWIKRALNAAPYASLELRNLALSGAGNLAYSVGELETAREYFDQSLALRRRLGDERGMAAALGSLGMVANDMRDYAHAQRLLEQSLAKFSVLEDERSMALTRGNLAAALTGLKDYEQSRSLHMSNVETFRALGDRHNLALALNNLTSVILQCDDYLRARAALDEAIQIGSDLQNAALTAQSLMNYAALAIQEGYMLRAARLLGAFMRSRETIAGGFRAAALEEYKRRCDEAQETLDEAAFEAAWREGYTMHSVSVLACAISLSE